MPRPYRPTLPALDGKPWASGRYYGARKSQRIEANLALLEELFAALPSLPFDDTAAAHYGLIPAQLSAAGQPIGANDLLIAATALAHDATVVTRNREKFRRVPGLRCEAW